MEVSSKKVRGWEYLEEQRKGEEWQIYLAGRKLASFLEVYKSYITNLFGLPPELITNETKERDPDETRGNRILHAQRSESINGKRVLRSRPLRTRPH